MEEQSKAFERRMKDDSFTRRWMRGRVLDVGCGNDPLKTGEEGGFPLIEEVVPWDQIIGSGDATFLKGLEDLSFDTVHSSHCLEHLADPVAAMTNWMRVLKRPGHLVVTIPDEYLYEQGTWPSRWNADHKHSFTTKHIPIISRSINVLNLLWRTKDSLVERVQLIRDGWLPGNFGKDQTLAGAECAIEFVIRKV